MIRASIVLVLVGALVFTACASSSGTDVQVVDEDLAVSIEGLADALDDLQLALAAAAPADVDRLTVSIEALKVKNGELSGRMATLERTLLELSIPPNTGDNWSDIRDTATPEMRRAVKLYAECRAGE